MIINLHSIDAVPIRWLTKKIAAYLVQGCANAFKQVALHFNAEFITVVNKIVMYSDHGINIIA